MIVSELIGGEVRARFSERDTGDAMRLFETTALPLLDFPSPNAAQQLERDRVHLAVLKLAEGNVTALAEALDIASKDWRDTLVGAGLADDNWPDILREAGFPVP